jgi:flagellar biosynthetic protein FlhB
VSNQPPRSEKTERPTEKRLRKAYEKGNIPRSQEVGQLVALVVFLAWAFLAGHQLLEGLGQGVRKVFAEIPAVTEDRLLLDLFVGQAGNALLLMAPLLLPLLAVAVVAQVAQTGYHPRKNVINFELNRLNPVNGIKNFFSFQKTVAAAKALLKFLIYVGLAVWVIVPAWSDIMSLALDSPGAITNAAAGVVADILEKALLVGLPIAAIDLGITRRNWYKKLFMTKKEVKDEHRENEGDPTIKGKRRQRQYEMANRRMMNSVATANVVVTNPTHVAVALKYDMAMSAPVVIAKGRGHVALRIRELAKEHRVPIVEDPPLARVLERICPLDKPIPATLYRAVAEVLAYVMGRTRGAYRQHPEVEDEMAAGGRR